MKKRSKNYYKIKELEAEIELNEMMIEDFSYDKNDPLYKGWVNENKLMKKRIEKLSKKSFFIQHIICNEMGVLTRYVDELGGKVKHLHKKRKLLIQQLDNVNDKIKSLGTRIDNIYKNKFKF